jgi:hypothetical protein
MPTNVTLGGDHYTVCQKPECKATIYYLCTFLANKPTLPRRMSCPNQKNGESDPSFRSKRWTLPGSSLLISLTYQNVEVRSEYLLQT